jgi:arginase
MEEDVGPSNLLNFGALVDGTRSIHRKISEMNGVDKLIAIGGECSLAVGEFAGLKERLEGRLGLIWMDSHGDFNTPDTTPSGYIGGMCLAFVCGRGPPAYQRVDSMMPLVKAEDVVHLGSRALDDEELASMLSSGMKLVPMKELRKKGTVEAAADAFRELERRVDHLALHLDVDVVDPEFLPAVNYPEPGGLTPGELVSILRLAARSPKLRALNVTAYNSERDHEGESAKRIVKILANSLGSPPI